jgi:hypothetical protein
MKSAKFLVLLAIGLLLSCCVLISDASSAYRSHLEGTWYLGGDRNKVTRIVSTRDGLEARNEHGQTSRLEYDGRGRVRALDWGGISGEIRGDRIQWSNNTYWTRARNPTVEPSRLVGTWYSGGNRDKVARIVDTRGGLEARNEHGQPTRLVPDGRNSVVALDWEGGLRAEIRNDRINWANGTFWTRRPY